MAGIQKETNVTRLKRTVEICESRRHEYVRREKEIQYKDRKRKELRVVGRIH